MENNEFKCGKCFKVFKKRRSDVEAMEEAKNIFGKPVKEWKDKPVVVCGDCFEAVHPRKYPELLEETKKIL